MIVYLRLLSPENDEFVKEIAINDNQSFAELHDYIQEMLDYDPAQMASFYTTDHEWNKEVEVTLIDMAYGEVGNVKEMQNTLLSELINKKGQRLLYIFDFFSERAFFIEIMQLVDGELEKAKCIRNDGKAPEQIMIGDMTGNSQKQKMSVGSNEFDGTVDSLDFTSLDEIDMDNEEFNSL
ncbi:IS1096 element passenger TnpR family protein [Carboxylicivirga sp. N1Y90]|uniref:IS1096 element passenger TnpR family protein n=1 Tax=Carboxylicivirga fragile TaxID=3417571 RepID=UPI003D34D4B3|nr:hypothetical protein [Marinilabiliaceae bacterium N1Y90]